MNKNVEFCVMESQMQNFTQRIYLHFFLHVITLLLSLGHNSNYMQVPPVVILKSHEFC